MVTLKQELFWLMIFQMWDAPGLAVVEANVVSCHRLSSHITFGYEIPLTKPLLN